MRLKRRRRICDHAHTPATGGKQVGAVVGKRVADVGIGLRHAFGVVLCGVSHHEIKGDSELQRSRGSSRMSVKR